MYINSTTKIQYCFYFRYPPCTLSDNTINMQILFFVAEIGTSKNKNKIFNVIFWNKDISANTLDITMKFSMTALHIPFEGSVSQNFYLGPSFYFM